MSTLMVSGAALVSLGGVYSDDDVVEGDRYLSRSSAPAPFLLLLSPLFFQKPTKPTVNCRVFRGNAFDDTEAAERQRLTV